MKAITIITVIIMSAFTSNAQLKKNGTPDMRFRANKEMYGSSYSTPSYQQSTYSTPSHSSYTTTPNYPAYTAPSNERQYKSGGEIRIQDGYQKSNGTYVAPHLKTSPDNNPYNNLKPKF